MVFRLDLKLGFLCNNNCLCCPQAHRRHLGDLTTQEAKEKLIAGRNDGATEVVFTGGEPTMRADLPELVRYARSIGYEQVQIQSNGRRFYYKAYCKLLIDSGVTEFAPSIHGHLPELHDYITQARGAFKQVIQGIKNLKELNQRVITNSVITKQNYKYLPELAQMLVNLNVDQFQLAFIHCVGNAYNNMDLLCPRKSDVQPYVHKALDIAIEAGVPCMVEAYPYCFMVGYERYCSELYMPPAEIRDAEGVIKDFDTVRKTSDKLKHEKCKKCKYYLICEGPWKQYPEKYGWSEFKPVPGEYIKDPSEVLKEHGGTKP
jgi:radical SAM protein with 4Fe4S-binding SPASM domain